jgi:hypothetical protein
MSTIKKIVNLLEIIAMEPGLTLSELCVEKDVLPLIMEDWLEMLALDEMIVSRHDCDAGGIAGWHILPKGEESIAWLYNDTPTEEA